MRFSNLQAVFAKYSLLLGLDERSALAEWEAALRTRLAEKKKLLSGIRHPMLKAKAETEAAELQEATQMVAVLDLFARLTRCLQEDNQAKFEWELTRPEAQAVLPAAEHPLYGRYLDIVGDARKKWPGAPPAPKPAPVAPVPQPAPQPPGPPPAPVIRVPKEPAEEAPKGGRFTTAPPALPHSEVHAGILRRRLAEPLTIWQKQLGDTLQLLAGARIRTLQELLTHQRPPAKALNVAKDAFKQLAGTSPDRPPEQEVALLLYLLVILAARVRLEIVISKLPESELARAINWALELKWLDPDSRKLVLQARSIIRNPAGD